MYYKSVVDVLDCFSYLIENKINIFDICRPLSNP